MKKDFEHQLDEIRVGLHERTKDMTNSDAVRVTNENAKKIAEQYGIVLTKGATDTPDKRVSNL
ncbi:MAG: hypothetical protein FWG31_05860 [Oscillospiraceae bacterium]|nr:hypothetical protein [Oscillospiraceae bacterium]